VLSQNEHFALKFYLVTIASRHNTTLGKRISALLDINSKDTVNNGLLGIGMAINTVNEDPTMAYDIAKETIQSSPISKNLVYITLNLLDKLGETDPILAKKLFLETLHKISSSLPSNAEDIVTLGTYVSVSPKLSYFQEANKNTKISSSAIFPIVIDNIQLIDISLDRPGTSAELIIPFLDICSSVLSKPTTNIPERTRNLLYLKLLFPRIRRHLPAKSLELYNILNRDGLVKDLQGMEMRIPDHERLKEEQVYNEKSFDDKLKEIEKNGDSKTRDGRLIILVKSLIADSNFDNAREAASRVKESKYQELLEYVIDYEEISQGIRKRAITGTKHTRALRFTEGRVLIYLKKANAFLVDKDLDQANESLTYARLETESANSDKKKWLFLSIGRLSLKLDKSLAINDLITIVNLFNSSDIDLLIPNWSVLVGEGIYKRDFVLDVAPISFNFREMVKSFLEIDYENNLSILSGLKKEQWLSEFIYATCEYLISNHSKTLKRFSKKAK
jgi:hypothetical protein